MTTFAVCLCGEDADFVHNERHFCGEACAATSDVERAFDLPLTPFHAEVREDLLNFVRSALENVESPDEVGDFANYWVEAERIGFIFERITTFGLWDYEIPEGIRTIADAARWICCDFMYEVAYHVLSMDLRGDA
jgi:hypothetical protein